MGSPRVVVEINTAVGKVSSAMRLHCRNNWFGNSILVVMGKKSHFQTDMIIQLDADCLVSSGNIPNPDSSEIRVHRTCFTSA